MFAGKIARLLLYGIKARGEAIAQSQNTSDPDNQTFGSDRFRQRREETIELRSSLRPKSGKWTTNGLFGAISQERRVNAMAFWPILPKFCRLD